MVQHEQVDLLAGFKHCSAGKPAKTRSDRMVGLVFLQQCTDADGVAFIQLAVINA